MVIDKDHGGSCGLMPSIDLWLMFLSCTAHDAPGTIKDQRD